MAGVMAAGLCLGALGFAQSGEKKLNSGREIFETACIACHGPNGKGMSKAVLGFDPPSTYPDFSRCDQTTSEWDRDYKAVIRDGGPARGFSQIMPAFREVLSSEQMDEVIRYLRSFCQDKSWPRAILNMPRALATEKAYPENEAVITSAINTRSTPGVDDEFAYEHRLGVRNQLEVAVPLSFVNQSTGTWSGGIGDIALGLKRAFIANVHTGSIFALQGEVVLPTGNRSRGLGTGVTTFGMFASYDQLLPRNGFVEFQGGADLPTHLDKVPQSMFWRTAVGKSMSGGLGLGRLWSPMVEFLADRDLQTGARTNWDVLPEFQVTLSQRQHVRADFGVRVPANHTSGRPVQLMFYVLWDWFDGALRDGW